MGKSPLLADFIHTRACKPICAKLLTLPAELLPVRHTGTLVEIAGQGVPDSVYFITSMRFPTTSSVFPRNCCASSRNGRLLPSTHPVSMPVRCESSWVNGISASCQSICSICWTGNKLLPSGVLRLALGEEALHESAGRNRSCGSDVR